MTDCEREKRCTERPRKVTVEYNSVVWRLKERDVQLLTTEKDGTWKSRVAEVEAPTPDLIGEAAARSGLFTGDDLSINNRQKVARCHP